MKKMKKAIALFLALSLLCMSFSSCTLVLPDLDILDSDKDKPPKDEELDNGGVKDDLEDSSVKKTEDDALSASVAIGEELSLSDLLPDGIKAHSWESACVGVAKVKEDKVQGVKFGKTEIYAKDKDGKRVAIIDLYVEFPIANNNGYTFPKATDSKIYEIKSFSEADRIVDIAVANHVSEVILDFSYLGDDFDPFVDYRGSFEFSNHVSYKMKKYDNKPQVLYITVTYHEDAATEVTDTQEQYRYTSVVSGNSVLRDLLSDKTRRPDDYEGFAISSAGETFDVYNSEELWWAVEHGYRPVFPMANSKAELFYERAKTILREIVSDGMTDTEKVIAIYEYLIHLVNYDYDTFYSAETNEDSKSNSCYYLEGVFESGKAVCDGKSKAFVLLCGIEGVECVRDFGDGQGDAVGHAWNYVRLNDSWYMIDTTYGDVSSASSAGFGSAFGTAVEIVDCVGFLLPTDHYEGVYTYSRMWDEILAAVNDSQGLHASFFTTPLYQYGCDFKIGSQSEINELIKKLLSSDESDSYMLALTLDNSVYPDSSSIFTLMDKALKNCGFMSPRGVYKVFESEFQGIKVLYIALFNV